jgi:exonuclease SbcC
MRPVRLALQGFTTFRTMSEPIDFSDVDVFALTGPTGSGKSSIVDAMCFALYGSVPRLDRGKVEPVISLGAQEARIFFEFTVDGLPYTIGRVVKRTKTGATTAEATLEGGPEVVAGADQVTEAVEDLLGLPFEDFTRSVVLPQGEFAAFLHDKPSRRQDLLRRLLDLGVYERMRRIAQHRRARLEAEAVLLEGQVTELGEIDPEEVESAGRRSEALAVLRFDIEAALPDLERLAGEAAEARRVMGAIEDRIGVVARLARPSGIERLATATAEAVAAADAAKGVLDGAVRATSEAERLLAEAGDDVSLTETLRLHEQRSDLDQRHVKGEDLIAATGQELSAAQETLEATGTALRLAVEVERATRTAHAAHAIRVDLVSGEVCPVCRQVVDGIPSVEVPAELAESEEARVGAEVAERKAAAETERLSALLVAYRDRLAELEAERAKVTSRLDGRPEPDEVRMALTAVEAARSALNAARKQEQEARDDLELKTGALERARAQEEGAWADLDKARDTVAELGPPPTRRGDLSAAWEGLLEWGRGAAERLDRDRHTAMNAAEEAVRARDALVGGFVERATGLGVDTDASGVDRDVVATSVAAAAQVSRLEERAQRAVELAESAKGRRQGADVAASLTRHLAANNFQAWILEEAFLGLVASANAMLGQLSSQAYSLHVDRRDFVVVDHRNADETRSVKTLSGGETFLVSLSLALALAEQLSMIGGAGGARLESIFLDEGFGTLDSDTLDTVSSVIQELGATGRTVGIITHVSELAEQVPVRFEVRKLPGGSVVTRVEA